jgi:hypothetical protein
MRYQSPTTCFLRNNTYWRTSQIRNLEKFLKLYPNKTAAYELFDGFSNGFKIKYNGPRSALETKNLKSVFN